MTLECNVLVLGRKPVSRPAVVETLPDVSIAPLPQQGLLRGGEGGKAIRIP